MPVRSPIEPGSSQPKKARSANTANTPVEALMISNATPTAQARAALTAWKRRPNAARLTAIAGMPAREEGTELSPMAK